MSTFWPEYREIGQDFQAVDRVARNLSPPREQERKNLFRSHFFIHRAWVASCYDLILRHLLDDPRAPRVPP
jgi:hypothetical protein